MARLPNFLVIIRSEKLSGKGQGRGAKKRTFRFGKKNVSFPKVETFRFADYTMIAAGGLGEIVLKGITQMKIGLGFEGGIAVVILAIILDRITQGLGKQKKGK